MENWRYTATKGTFIFQWDKSHFLAAQILSLNMEGSEALFKVEKNLPRKGRFFSFKISQVFAIFLSLSAKMEETKSALDPFLILQSR